MVRLFRLVLASVIGCMLLSVSTSAGAAPVARLAAASASLGYMAVGDSYSSGEANSPFTNNSGCDVSANTSWPLMLATSNNLSAGYHNFACSGAGIWSLTQAWGA